MRGVWVTGMALAVCAVVSFICILFVDRPVEVFVHAHQHYRRFFQAMAAPSLLSLPLALTYLAGYAIAATFGRLRPAGLVRPGRWEWGFLSLSVAILAATAMKDEMKWMFGRPWPDSWVQFGLYAFKPFTDNMLYGCFPSGHTAYMAAPMFMLCWLVPKCRWLWLALMGMVMAGLVAGGYHYVSDVIAGMFVGLAAAAGTVALLPAAARSAKIAV